jgi:hypothetical protein
MRPLVLCSLFLLAPVSSLLSQDECLRNLKLPQEGNWAEYRAVFQDKEPVTMRYAVVGSEARDAKKLQWVEMRMTGGKEKQDMIYQILVPGSLVEIDQVQEVVFKAGDKPAMRLNGMMMNMIRDQLEKQSTYSRICRGVTLVGTESISVPAGKFKSLHFRNAEQGVDSWISPEVPFSMVKTVGKDFQMELANKGTGAQSSISEKPQEMGGMGGPPKTE